ncbi:MAG: hypothetical protein EXR36_09455 [Betaproteobacteria bacterium]|nr:hypothetical protein [Betaproteobacteria bacterium]
MQRHSRGIKHLSWHWGKLRDEPTLRYAVAACGTSISVEDVTNVARAIECPICAVILRETTNPRIKAGPY